MSASIKILKECLKDHRDLSAQLGLLCAHVREEFDACVYTPHPGVLITCLKLLSERNVTYELVYGDHQDTPNRNSPEI